LLAINHDAPDSQQSVALRAPQTADFTLAAICQGANPPCSTNTVATITGGQSVSFNIIGTPISALPYPNPVVITCSNLPSATWCTFTPSNALNLNTGPQTVTLTIHTTGSSAQLVPPFGKRTRTSEYAFLLAALPMALVRVRCAGRHRTSGRSLSLLALFTVVLLMSSLLVACGDAVGNSRRPTTSPGTYTITVAATAGSVQHTLNITVVVE
jgi:hypothetical protein